MGNKQVVKELTKIVDRTSKELVDEVKQATKSGWPPELEEMAKEHQMVTVTVRRKSGGSFAFFTQLEGVNLKELMNLGFDTFCQREGGAGEYQLELRVADGEGKPFKTPTFKVLGEKSYSIPKAQRDLKGLPEFGDISTLTGSRAAQNQSADLGKLLEAFGAQNQGAQQRQENSNDRMMSIMLMSQQAQRDQQAQMLQQQRDQQAQQQQMQQQMLQQAQAASADNIKLLMTLMAPRQDDSSKEELRALREQVNRQIDDRRNEEKINQLQQQILLANKGGDKETVWGQLLAQQSTNSQNQTAQTLDLFKMMMDRPTDDDKMRNMTETVSNMMANQVNMFGQMMQSGLLGGNDGSPLDETIRQGLQNVAEVATAVLSRGGEEEEMTAEQIAQMQRDQTANFPAPMPLGQLPEAGEPRETIPPPPIMHPQEGQQPAPIELLTNEELESFEKDPALRKIVIFVQNGEEVSEISARIFSHKNSKHAVAEKMFKSPAIVAQVLQHYNIPEPRIIQVIENMGQFHQYLNGGGDPNTWAKTGYKPLKQVKSQTSFVQGESPAGMKPDFGVTQKEPLQGEEYDPSQPPVKAETASEPTKAEAIEAELVETEEAPVENEPEPEVMTEEEAQNV
jgi:hypothetical protein